MEAGSISFMFNRSIAGGGIGTQLLASALSSLRRPVRLYVFQENQRARHFYEESAKVPLLVSCPQLFEGKEVENRLIQNIDIAPTILESFGIDKPEHMHGASFLPILQGKEVEWRDRIFYEYYR